MNTIEMGQKLRIRRKQAGLTQAQLALLANVAKTVVFDLEKGKTTVQLNSILKVLAVLNMQLKTEIIDHNK